MKNNKHLSTSTQPQVHGNNRPATKHQSKSHYGAMSFLLLAIFIVGIIAYGFAYHDLLIGLLQYPALLIFVPHIALDIIALFCCVITAFISIIRRKLASRATYISVAALTIAYLASTLQLWLESHNSSYLSRFALRQIIFIFAFAAISLFLLILIQKTSKSPKNS